jgi:hypothetical protein
MGTKGLVVLFQLKDLEKDEMRSFRQCQTTMNAKDNLIPFVPIIQPLRMFSLAARTY